MRTWKFAISLLLVACGGESAPGDPDAETSRDGAEVDAASIDAVPIDAATDSPVDAQLWPPVDVGIQIGAAAAGDVDGDGRDDLLLVLTGGPRGVHVFRGGNVDLDDHGAIVGTPDYAQLLTPSDPTALAMYDGLPVVVAGFGIASMTVLDSDLSLYNQQNLPFGVSQSDTLALSAVAIGPTGALAIVAKTEIHYVERETLRLNPPTLRTLSQPPVPFATARSLGSSTSGTLVVAEQDTASIGTPPASGGDYTWVQRPLAGAPWSAMLVADVTADGRPDVIGYRNGAGDAQLCVHDGGDAPGIQPGCRVLTGQNAEYAALLFDELDPSVGRDLIVSTVILPGTGMGLIEAYPDLRISAQTVSSGTRRTMTLPRPPVAMVAIDVDDDGDKELMLIDSRGTMRCTALTAAGFVDC